MVSLKSAIYGLAVGDALGVPFEFKKRGTFLCQGMTGHGTHNQQAGTWSDDTSMTLATCQSIKDNHGICESDIRKKFLDWLNTGAFTPDGVAFDCGVTTYEALHRGTGSRDFYSNGNGALMRILPLAFIDCTDEEIDTVSAMTHAHEISKEACRIYVKIARTLLAGENLRSAIQAVEMSKVFERIHELENLSEAEIKSSGYVVDTLEASLWCLLQTENYQDAVLKAVNLGDDTDTVGAVTGGLAGILYGYSGIPGEWIDALRKKELIDRSLVVFNHVSFYRWQKATMR